MEPPEASSKIPVVVDGEVIPRNHVIKPSVLDLPVPAHADITPPIIPHPAYLEHLLMTFPESERAVMWRELLQPPELETKRNETNVIPIAVALTQLAAGGSFAIDPVEPGPLPTSRPSPGSIATQQL